MHCSDLCLVCEFLCELIKCTYLVTKDSCLNFSLKHFNCILLLSETKWKCWTDCLVQYGRYCCSGTGNIIERLNDISSSHCPVSINITRGHLSLFRLFYGKCVSYQTCSYWTGEASIRTRNSAHAILHIPFYRCSHTCFCHSCLHCIFLLLQTICEAKEKPTCSAFMVVDFPWFRTNLPKTVEYRSDYV